MQAPSFLFLPPRVNTGPWVGGCSRTALDERIASTPAVLPICSLGTPADELAKLGALVLPPLYHEALDADLETALVAQIRRCFPYFEGTRRRREVPAQLEVVRLPARSLPAPQPAPAVLAFGADTTIEQHGPHLPLATDTIQTYAVLQQLAAEDADVMLGPPLEYGHLTWGLPFGFSVDLTPPLLERYARRFIRALVDWCQPRSIYVADVHGSTVHCQILRAVLQETPVPRSMFRWLHEPLVEFAGQRGDVHAGAVETLLVEHIAPNLVDARWWPARSDVLIAGQMTAAEATSLSDDLRHFIARVEAGALNGIVDDLRGAPALEPVELMGRMLEVARTDLRTLRA